jgi:hypothetical protein
VTGALLVRKFWRSRQHKPFISFISLMGGVRVKTWASPHSKRGVEELLSSLSALAAHRVGLELSRLLNSVVGRQAAR